MDQDTVSSRNLGLCVTTDLVGHRIVVCMIPTWESWPLHLGKPAPPLIIHIRDLREVVPAAETDLLSYHPGTYPGI